MRDRSPRAKHASRVIGLLLSAVFLGCSLWHVDERSAVLRVEVGDKAVYLKRRVWGRNGSAIVISATSDWREIPRSSDYVWTAQEPPILLYQVKDATLHIWGNGMDTWSHPTSAPFPVQVVFHEVDVQTASAMMGEARQRGLKVLRDADWPLHRPPIEPVDVK